MRDLFFFDKVNYLDGWHTQWDSGWWECTEVQLIRHGTADVEIVVDPGILVPRKYLSWQKIFVKVTTLNHKIEYNVR